MLVLLGSLASPFVRRNRIDLFEKDYIFEKIQVFSREGQMRLAKNGQIRKVPVLIDGEKEIVDSFLIHSYLFNNNYSADYLQDLWKINEANDSAILLFQLRMFELDKTWENKLSQNHLKRIEDILNYFNAKEAENKLSHWDVRSQWLYCFLDWLNFREVISWEEKFHYLPQFISRFKTREDVIQTDPRN